MNQQHAVLNELPAADIAQYFALASLDQFAARDYLWSLQLAGEITEDQCQLYYMELLDLQNM